MNPAGGLSPNLTKLTGLEEPDLSARREPC